MGCIPFFLCIGKLSACRLFFCPGLIQALIQHLKLLPHKPIPIQHLLRCSRQSRKHRFRLCRSGTFQILLFPQQLQLLRQGSGRLGSLPTLQILLFQLLTKLTDLNERCLDVFPSLLDLSSQAAFPPFLLLQLTADALGIDLVIFNVGFQHRNAGLQLVGICFLGLNQASQTVCLHVFLMHLLRQPLICCIQLFQGDLGLIHLPGRLLVVRLDPDAVGTQTLQRLQPKGNLQSLHLIPQNQELLCPLALFPQRLHLQLQLRNLIIDAHQIFVGTAQLALRVLFSVAVAGDTRRLLKDFTPVCRLD